MAKGDKTENAKDKTAKPSRKKGGAKFILLMVVIGSLVPVIKPTLVVCLGLLPTLVALFVDTDKEKSTVTTIGFLNVAGVFPFLVELWSREQTMEAALSIVRQPVTWLVMFGAAGIGQLMLYTIPSAIAMLTVIRLETRAKKLHDGLEQLKAIWGPEVATSKPLGELKKGQNL